MCRNPRKAVQIHHLDENPANNDAENLAVLCLECHNETQVKGGFGRKLDAAQVRLFRDEWLKRVELNRALLPPFEEGDASGAPLDLAERRAHDRGVFARAQEIMSEASLQRLLEPIWNADEYYGKYLDMAAKYIDFLAAADNELLDDELRDRCEAMRRSFNQLFEFVAYNFFPATRPRDDRYVMHPRLNVDRDGSGDPDDMAKYWSHQEKLRQIVDGADTSWREFRRAVKRRLLL